jgi:hypothetical protein
VVLNANPENVAKMVSISKDAETTAVPRKLLQLRASLF